MNTDWLGLFLVIAAILGFVAAWMVRGRQARTWSTQVTATEQARLAAVTAAEQLRAESAGLQARLEERTTRIEELQSTLRERDTIEAAAVKLREDVARLTAESEGQRQAIGERDQRIESLDTTMALKVSEILEVREQVARLEAGLKAERETAAEKLALLDEARAKLGDSFKALSAEALQDNNQSFLDLAKAQMGEFRTGAAADLDQRSKAIGELVAPIRDSLQRVDAKLQEVEKVRAEAYGALTTQLQSVAETQRLLHNETSNLVRALRAPSVRGRWGEVQLRRVVELAGMAQHCDFTEQPVAESPDGRVRPDLLVHLPRDRKVIVDAKVPLDAYLRALEAPDEAARNALLRDHARQVRDHMTKLAGKNYWIHFDQTPDHVVMFIPGEVFFFAALQHDPELIEYGVSKNVFVAGPTTLISLLRTVAYGWRQERIAENAEAISRNGRELYDRIGTMAEHLRRLGGALDRSVEAYNQMIGSFETRVLVGARRFKALGATSGAELEPLDGIERVTRQVQAGEFGEGEPPPPSEDGFGVAEPGLPEAPSEEPNDIPW